MDENQYIDQRLELPADTVTESGMKKYRVREKEYEKGKVREWVRGRESGFGAVFVASAWKDFANLDSSQADTVQDAMTELLENPFGKRSRRLMPSTDRYRFRMDNGSIVYDIVAAKDLVVVLRVSIKGAKQKRSSFSTTVFSTADD